MRRTGGIVMLARYRSVKAIDLNIGKPRGIFKHDDVLDAAAYRRARDRDILATELRHCGHTGNWRGQRNSHRRRRKA